MTHDELAVLKAEIFRAFIKKPTMNRSELMRKVWVFCPDVRELDAAMLEFDRADMIRMEPHYIYTMPPKVIEDWRKFQASKMK